MLHRLANARCVLIAFVLFAITLGLYWPVLHHDFITLDDRGYVLLNPHVRTGLTWPNVLWAFTSSYGANWHPLTWLSHMLDCQLYGLNPGGHHFTSALLHALNTALLFLFLLRFTGSPWRSAFVAALFGLHPLHVESVAWIAERKDVLSGFFFLVTLWTYAEYAERKDHRTVGVPDHGTTGPPDHRTTGPLAPGGNIQTAMCVGTMDIQCCDGAVPLASSGGEVLGKRSPLRPSVSGKEADAAPTGRCSSRAAWFYTASLLLFTLGLLSKPMLVTLPFVLLLLDFWPLGRFRPPVSPHDNEPLPDLPLPLPQPIAPRRKFSIFNFQFSISNSPRTSTAHQSGSHCPQSRPGSAFSLQPLVFEKLPFFLLSAVASVITFLVQQHAGAVAPVTSVPLLFRLENALLSYVIYIGKTLWPTHLAVFYPYPGRWPLWQVCACAAILISITFYCARARGAFISSTTASSPLPARSANAGASRGYLLVGWLWFLGMLVPVIGLVQVGLQARADRYTYLPSIGLFIALTWFAADLARSTLNAQRSTLRALRAMLPALPLFALSLATWHQLAYWRDAETLYRRTLAVTGPNPIIHANLGTALVEQGRFKEAETEFATAVRLKPDYAEALSDLGLVLATQGRNADALPCFEKALSLDPAMQQAHYLLAGCLLAQHRSGEAITELRAALELNPDWPAALNDLAWLLATGPDEHFRNGPEAVALAEKACRLTQFQQPVFIGTLAAAYAEAGQWEQAVATAEKARQLAESLRLTEVANRNASLKQWYQSHRAYHDGQVLTP